MIKTGIKISEARIGITADDETAVSKEKFYWLDTNFLSADFIPFEGGMDSFVRLENSATAPEMAIERDTLKLKGDFSALYEKAGDKRYTVFGNLGIFSGWVLRTLEEKKGVFTLHSCGLVKDGRLMVVSGGAGSGKTIFMLSALKKGWKIFSTEFLHFKADGKLKFFKGSLKDAVRADSFRGHFPGLAKELKVDLKEEAGSKLVVDFSPFQYGGSELEAPEIILVFPHVEESRSRVIRKKVGEREVLLRNLFENASEKIGKSMLLYGEWPLPGLDEVRLAAERLRNIGEFLGKGRIADSFSWVSGVKDVEEVFEG